MTKVIVTTGKDIECSKCGRIFKVPKWRLKPLGYKAGMKMPGGLISLGAIIACPKCFFDGSVKDSDQVWKKRPQSGNITDSSGRPISSILYVGRDS